MTLMKRIQINVRSLVGLNMDLSCKTNEFETKQVFDLCTWIINGNYYIAASGILTSPEFIHVYSQQLYASSSKFNIPCRIVWVGSTEPCKSKGGRLLLNPPRIGHQNPLHPFHLAPYSHRQYHRRGDGFGRGFFFDWCCGRCGRFLAAG